MSFSKSIVKIEYWINWNDYEIFMIARRNNFDVIMTLDDDDVNKLLISHTDSNYDCLEIYG